MTRSNSNKSNLLCKFMLMIVLYWTPVFQKHDPTWTSHCSVENFCMCNKAISPNAVLLKEEQGWDDVT